MCTFGPVQGFLETEMGGRWGEAELKSYYQVPGKGGLLRAWGGGLEIDCQNVNGTVFIHVLIRRFFKNSWFFGGLQRFPLAQPNLLSSHSWARKGKSVTKGWDLGLWVACGNFFAAAHSLKYTVICVLSRGRISHD